MRAVTCRETILRPVRRSPKRATRGFSPRGRLISKKRPDGAGRRRAVARMANRQSTSWRVPVCSARHYLPGDDCPICVRMREARHRTPSASFVFGFFAHFVACRRPWRRRSSRWPFSAPFSVLFGRRCRLFRPRLSAGPLAGSFVTAAGQDGKAWIARDASKKRVTHAPCLAAARAMARVGAKSRG